MGGLSGSPKAPSQPKTQIVYVPSVTSPSTETGTNQEETLQERANNVLQRSRGRLGTVLSGFRGVLTQSDMTVQRKTLLGE